MRWLRRTPLDGVPRSRQTEQWVCEDSGEQVFYVDVTIGKALDVLALKGAFLGQAREYSDMLARTARDLYPPHARLAAIEACPACDSPASEARIAGAVFGVDYVQCAACGHGFVRERPTEAALAALFAESELYASTYTDKSTVELRLKEIVKPKLDWCMATYTERYGEPPRSVLDVGAGGGHFMAGAMREGLATAGFETSSNSRAFARAAFEIDLQPDDFLAAPVDRRFDLVTFWGLLEYTPHPQRFLYAARRWLTPGRGLLVVEVPRWDCVGTAVQMVERSIVARHLDPTSHVNTFSDASLATAMLRNGFRPVAAWYFGMDAYELLMQMALRTDDSRLLERFADLINPMQAACDRARLCDDLVLAAAPLD